jgi:hypothetical protein
MGEAPPARVAALLRWGGGVALVALAGVVAVISTLPYDEYVARVSAATIDGDDAGRPAYDAFVVRGRIAAAALLALGALWVVTPRPSAVLAGVGRSWGCALRDVPARLAGWGRSDPGAVLGLVGATVVAVALRVRFLDVPLRYDEATTLVNFVSDPLHTALAEYPTPNNHLLHTALAKLSVTLLGATDTALRLPALLAGILLVPLTFALGLRLHGRTTALLAAAAIATSSTLVEYSTNARGYTLLAACTAVCLLAAASIAEGAGRSSWAALVLAAVLGCFAIPIMVYAFGGTLLWLAWSLRVRGQELRTTFLRPAAAALGVTGVLVALLYLPVIVVSGPSAIVANEFLTPLPFGELVEGLPAHARETAATWVRDLPLAVALVLGASLLASLVAWRRLGRFPPPLVPLVAWTLVVVAFQRVIPYTRVWLFLLPALAVAVCAPPGHLVDRRAARWAALPATLAVLVLGSWAVVAGDTVRTSRETGALLDAPAVAQALGPLLRPGDAVVAPGSDVILQVYLERAGVDPSPLFDDERAGRVFLVTNVLGGQTVADVLDDAGLPQGTGTEVVRRWPSATLYVVRDASGAS